MVIDLQRNSQAYVDPTTQSNSFLSRPKGEYAPTLKIAEMFYTENGLPIDQDHSWDYDSRYDVETATTEDRYYIRPNYETAKLHSNGKPQFIAKPEKQTSNIQQLFRYT